ncbi:hypothetical protein PPTG_20067 [Phytophthora nicotianae INRA-310]|uniref:Necrosis inducing protein NPP1 type n=1 Tax=Phytophthora nicotianae (strain INRA-310) TaxID=761204 RepID=W2P9W1_PHYN3|nr:hypothetical protein PPTG_20067 [Phytophthora nicotianae INRA-310]ETM97621.1 hypothetical protein PPTG_20067 [Phytophthora nicotianae INRA-310]
MFTEPREPYYKLSSIPRMAYVGAQKIFHNRISLREWNYTFIPGSNESIRVTPTYWNSFEYLALHFSETDGQFQDLIMWEQLTDEARLALNSADFGESKVPFNDENIEETLELAWAFP